MQEGRPMGFSDINSSVVEGKLLIAAIAKIMGYEGDKTPDEIMHDLVSRIQKMK